VLIISREFVINGLRSFLEAKGISFAADWGGKMKMIQQCIAIPAVFFFKLIELWCAGIDWAVSTTLWFAHAMVWLMLVLTIGTGASYMQKGGRLLRQQI
jgi:phosphatidylglycerophosphate synthase